MHMNHAGDHGAGGSSSSAPAVPPAWCAPAPPPTSTGLDAGPDASAAGMVAALLPLNVSDAIFNKQICDF